jgi:hypothetical protein
VLPVILGLLPPGIGNSNNIAETVVADPGYAKTHFISHYEVIDQSIADLSIRAIQISPWR